MHTSPQYRNQARAAWSQARRKALWHQLRGHLQGQTNNLLNFTDVSQRLHLRTAFYRGVKNIPLKKIVGSVGRYQDFQDAFLPITPAMQDRWQSVATLYLNPEGGAPPIEVYQVGDAYFVRDGNHRVSVANQLGLIDIEARVWEYPEQVVGLAESRNLDLALAETEHQAFLGQTQLDMTHPACDIRLTASGGYETMLGQIVYYQYVLGEIDGEEKTFAEAASAWYTLFYLTTVQAIDEAQIMDIFPGRTTADFFIWTILYHRELEDQYGETVLMQEAVKDLGQDYQPQLNTAQRLWRHLRQLPQRLLKSKH